MKRFLSFVGVGVLFVTTPSFVWAAEGCTIRAVQGAPSVIREGQKMNPQVNDSLKKGDMISTDGECQADLSMNDLAGCRILGGTQLEVVDWKRDNMSVRIVDGNIILNLKKLPDDAAFRVETPTAIAAVRGTQFWGRVSRPTPDNPVTTFAVREGTVDVTPIGGSQSYRLEPGKALDLTLGETSPSLRDALPEEMAAMEQAAAIPME